MRVRPDPKAGLKRLSQVIGPESTGEQVDVGEQVDDTQ